MIRPSHFRREKKSPSRDNYSSFLSNENFSLKERSRCLIFMQKTTKVDILLKFHSQRNSVSIT